jgi:heme exporter protein D
VLLIVWIAVAVLVLLVLGILAHSVLGAAGRLGRELRALEREAAPLLAEAQATAARAAAVRAERAATDD